jgi:O-antigen/teichoic acid export membrane protein
VFLVTLKKLTLICIPVFLILYIIVEPAFAFIFGEEWRASGIYARILIPLAAIRFISSTLSVNFIVYQKQKILLLFNISLLIFIIVIFLISKINNFNMETFLVLYTFLVSVIYLALLAINWNVSQKNNYE